MIEDWKNILKMLIPIVFVILFGISLNMFIVSNSILILGFKIILYTIVYCLLVWLFVMNNYEKDLIKKPLNKIIIKNNL